MGYLIICTVAFVASGLTFFSGFGLGTLLLPAFTMFVPVDQAIAMTAVVHFLNNVLKVALVGRHVDRRTIIRFGLPAIAAAVAGAWVLSWLSEAAPMYSYQTLGRTLEVTPLKLVIGVLLLSFACIEVIPRFRKITVGPEYMPLGGVLSGFFGGLSGMQGALRSAFLARAGLSTEVFIATGVVIACLVDLSRLGVYTGSLWRVRADVDFGLLAAAVAAAFAGAVLGNQYLKHMTMDTVQKIVAAMLVLVAIGLISGLIR